VPAMQRTLEDFLRSLRDNDVAISPTEAIDAHRALVDIGYADRTLLRDALCVTLAKGEDEVSRFERCFDTFFKRDSIEPAIDVDDNPPEDAPDLVRQVLLGDEAALSRAMEVAGAQVGAGNIRLATQRNLLVRRVLDAMERTTASRGASLRAESRRHRARGFQRDGASGSSHGQATRDPLRAQASPG
jgi:uncharacterized protein with von Willebrand factor type A (vWA) domain